MLDIIEATSPEQLAIARELLMEYEKAIGVDLCFQDFEAELRSLPGGYAPPSGRLLLATHDGRALVERVLSEARRAGYGEVVLDTLPSMQDAQRMYERFGFKDIPPYRPNPVVGTRYLGKDV